MQRPGTLTAVLTLTDAEGKTVEETGQKFLPTDPGKWGTLRMVTATSINAGDYTIKLSSGDAAKLSIAGVDVQ